MSRRFANSRPAPVDVWSLFQTRRRDADIPPCGFMACPAALLQGQPAAIWSWQQWLYAVALARAQAEVQAAEPQQDIQTAWN
jgi:hypothetical protein